jgi:hypothetical protein
MAAARAMLGESIEAAAPAAAPALSCRNLRRLIDGMATIPLLRDPEPDDLVSRRRSGDARSPSI